MGKRRIVAGDAPITIGRQGENDVTEVLFPVDDWIKKYGRGTFTLMVRRKPDKQEYLVPLTETEDGMIWTVLAADVQYEGEGKCVLAMAIDGQIAKSQTWITKTLKSIGTDATPNPAWQPYLNEVLSVVDEMKTIVPPGGETGQVLGKKSDADYDVGWVTPQGGGGAGMPAIDKITDYFYEARYDTTDDAYALEYFRSRKPHVNAGSCSAFVRDGAFVRLYDWTYDENAEFRVITPARGMKYAVEGISAALPLTDAFVESGEYSELYKLVPYFLTDGRNEKGLKICTNVVPLDYEKTTGTTPTETQEAEVCSVMLARWLLERYATAQEAADAVEKHISVFVPEGLHELGYEQHFMLADAEKVLCIEFVRNEVKVLDITDSPWITNFFRYGVTAQGDVFTPADVPDGNLPTAQGITDYGDGLERYNLIRGFDGTTKDLIDRLLYTNTYKRGTEPFWYSEYVGDTLTVDSPPEDFSGRVERYISAYEWRSRDDEMKTWQTVHAVIYGADGTMQVRVQEMPEWYEFSAQGSAGSWDELTGKPFERIGDGLTVEDGTLKANGGRAGYVHVQQTESEVWEINHDLGRYPGVTVIRPDGEQAFGEIKYMNGNVLLLFFSDAIRGTAYLS